MPSIDDSSSSLDGLLPYERNYCCCRILVKNKLLGDDKAAGIPASKKKSRNSECAYFSQNHGKRKTDQQTKSQCSCNNISNVHHIPSFKRSKVGVGGNHESSRFGMKRPRSATAMESSRRTMSRRDALCVTTAKHKIRTRRKKERERHLQQHHPKPAPLDAVVLWFGFSSSSISIASSR